MSLFHGVTLDDSFSLDRFAYSDADRASYPDDRKKAGGYCVFFGNNLVCWFAGK